MTVPEIDHMLVSIAVAFDAETGDVLHVHEKFVETVDGKPCCTAEVTPDECEKIRAEAALAHPRRRVDIVTAPPELGQREDEMPVRYHVDPMTRKLRTEPERDPRLGAGFTSRC
jgi:hypothetical protein